MYAFMKALCRFASRFSRQRLLGFAQFLTFIYFDLFRLRRRMLLQNLDIAFGSSKSRAEKLFIARESVRSFILTTFEMLAAERYPLTGHIQVEGEEHIRGAVAEGRGAFILCFHMGNFEAMAAKVSQTYGPTCAVMKKVGSAGMTRFIEEYRRNYGLEWIKRSQKGDGYRGISRALAQGHIYGFIFDQARPGEPRLPFFSRTAKTNTGLAKIWRQIQAPIVPCYIYRTDFAEHVMVFKPALELQASADEGADIRLHSAYFNRVLEECIREKPEQYFWLHNRWK